jgi:hypothetical protein
MEATVAKVIGGAMNAAGMTTGGSSTGTTKMGRRML